MKNPNVLRIFSILLLVTLILPTSLVYALTPTQAHDAHALWIEPAQVELNVESISFGYKFNVTAWANCSVPCGGWQLWLLYEKAYINATRAGYTGDGKSEFMQNVSTIPVSASFKPHNATFDRVEFGESWGGSGDKRSPGYGSLAWIEFNVTNIPLTAQEVALEFYAYTGATRKTYLINGLDSSKVDLNVYRGLVKFIPPPPDLTPPEVKITSPLNKTYTIATIWLNFTVNETASWIGYSLDDQANVTITGNATLTSLAEGSHRVVVYATDLSGNTGVSDPVYFTVLTSFIPGDLDGDKDIDIDDIYIAALAFGSSEGHPRWNMLADLDNDGYVSIFDLYLIASKFGTGS